MKLHPQTGLPDETEPDEDKMIDSWIAGFKEGRLTPEKFVPRIYMLGYCAGFHHGRKRVEELRKKHEKN